MIVTLLYIFDFLLLGVIIFLLIKTIVIAISMITEVPYVPSEKIYKKAIEYLEINEDDTVLDIGSGDGRVLFYASKKYPEAKFVGVERRIVLVVFSRIKRMILNRKNLRFIRENIHNFDIGSFNKIYMYLVPPFINELLTEKEKEIKSSTIIVSLHYPLGETFSSINKVIEYPVKYRGKKHFIYKGIKK